MKYPKQLMTITELNKMGYPKRETQRLCRVEDFPCRRSGQSIKATYLIETDYLDEWLYQHGMIKRKGKFKQNKKELPKLI